MSGGRVVDAASFAHLCDNCKSGARPDCRRNGPLTHPLDYTEEGLAMQATHADSFRYHVAPSGCWIWGGYRDPNGYGRIYNRHVRQIQWAHRFSFELHKEPIRPGNEIDHTCQVTYCVNPDHLDQVTKLEHARRTMARLGKDDLHEAAATLRRRGLTYLEIANALGYSGRESAHGAVLAAIGKGLVDADEIPRRSTLQEDDRADIRLMYAFGIPQTAIGRFYGVDSSQVSRICSDQARKKSA